MKKSEQARIERMLLLGCVACAAIASGRKLFKAVFGTEWKLLEKTDFLLGLDTPSPKELL